MAMMQINHFLNFEKPPLLVDFHYRMYSIAYVFGSVTEKSSVHDVANRLSIQTGQQNFLLKYHVLLHSDVSRINHSPAHSGIISVISLGKN